MARLTDDMTSREIQDAIKAECADYEERMRTLMTQHYDWMIDASNKLYEARCKEAESGLVNASSAEDL